jgi:AcrR family transcriptional regulator
MLIGRAFRQNRFGSCSLDGLLRRPSSCCRPSPKGRSSGPSPLQDGKKISRANLQTVWTVYFCSMKTRSPRQIAKPAGRSRQAAKAEATRDRQLDAAESVVLRDGVAALTLETVADMAGVSKGGLLYHFPSKRALVEALIARLVRLLVDRYDAELERAAPGPGRAIRAFVRGMPEDGSAEDKRLRRMTSALLAAEMEDPSLLAPLQAFYKRVFADIRADGGNEGLALAVLAAVDGLWLSELLGLYRLDPARRRALSAALERLLEAGA